jgi:hypothetical protein
MAAAGWDPLALKRYLERTQGEDTRMSRLPPKQERIDQLELVIQELPAGTYSADAEFSRIREIVREAALPSPDKAPTLRRPSDRR